MDLDGDLILVSTGEGSLKAKNTRRDARVGLSIIAMDNPYKEAQIRGRVVERRPDADFKTRIRSTLRQQLDLVKQEGLLVPAAAWGYFPVNAEGEHLIVRRRNS